MEIHPNSKNQGMRVQIKDFEVLNGFSTIRGGIVAYIGYLRISQIFKSSNIDVSVFIADVSLKGQ